MNQNFQDVKNFPSGEGGGSNTIIILAGGLGTRLRSVVADVPKCMAPVNGKPFLHYVIDHFIQQGITNFIFSVGYKHEIIVEFLEKLATQYSPITIQYSVETEPLGTGGAIKKACSFTNSKNVFATNGDTLFKADTALLQALHTTKHAACTLALKPMQNFDRYGVIELAEDAGVKSFNEKKNYAEGLINGGLYMLNVEAFLGTTLPEKFSFEKDYLEAYYTQTTMAGLVQDAYFIDIGIPEDYERAQREL